MDTPNHSIIAANVPLYLTIEEMVHPQDVVTSMFQGMNLDDIRCLLDYVFESGICRPDDELRLFNRGDLFFLKKETIRFVEAVSIIYKASQDQ